MTPQVAAEEVLYRQIPPNGDPIYFDKSRSPPVHYSLFLPTGSDVDGLSTIRAKYRSEQWSAVRLEKPDVEFKLAVLVASAAVRIANDVGFQQLTFALTPDSFDTQHGEPWGHCVIVEINRTDYDNNRNVKGHIKGWAREIAHQLTNSDILTPGLPIGSTLYRPLDID